ncbi:hypothetical protein PMAYCL1PPCAC_13901, partial [Pristionchus mayeri]
VQEMVCGILLMNRSFALLTVRRLTSIQPIVSELDGKSREQSSWKDLAEFSYGKATIDHREKLKKTLLDMRRVYENRMNSEREELRELKLVEIGSYAMGTSTPSSDLDFLILHM